MEQSQEQAKCVQNLEEEDLHVLVVDKKQKVFHNNFDPHNQHDAQEQDVQMNTMAFFLLNKSIFVGWQKAKVQEVSNGIQSGSLPRTIDVILRERVCGNNPCRRNLYVHWNVDCST